MLIPHNNRRRRNLLHRQSRQPALGRLQHVAISTTAPTAHLSLRWLQQRKVPGIHQRNHLGRRLYGSNHAPPNQRASNDDPDDQNVDTRRTQRPTPLVVVEAPDITHRLWLGLQLERWKFLRKKEFIQLPEKRLVQRLFEQLLSQRQVQLGLVAWRVRIQLCGSHDCGLNSCGQGLTPAQHATYTDELTLR